MKHLLRALPARLKFVLATTLLSGLSVAVFTGVDRYLSESVNPLELRSGLEQVGTMLVVMVLSFPLYHLLRRPLVSFGASCSAGHARRRTTGQSHGQRQRRVLGSDAKC